MTIEDLDGLSQESRWRDLAVVLGRDGDDAVVALEGRFRQCLTGHLHLSQLPDDDADQAVKLALVPESAFGDIPAVVS